MPILSEGQTIRDTQQQASRLFTQGRRAIGDNDVEGLKSAVRQLVGLLPPDEQEQEARGWGGTTMRAS